jgi:hypothetical protein
MTPKTEYSKDGTKMIISGPLIDFNRLENKYKKFGNIKEVQIFGLI